LLLLLLLLELELLLLTVAHKLAMQERRPLGLQSLHRLLLLLLLLLVVEVARAIER
jgi:hypothetical protein